MSLWWLQPGWTDACCAQCGQRIYPEGDPDWGLCWPCMSTQQEEQPEEEEPPINHFGMAYEDDAPPAPATTD